MQDDQMSEETQSREPFRMTEDERRQFLQDFLGGRIFSTNHCDPKDWDMVFVVIALGGFADYTKEELKKIGLIYEYLDKAFSRSVNGLPSFPSCHVMHIDDWGILRPVILAEQERLKTLPLP